VSADATGKDLVMISSTITATNVNTKFRAVAVPVVVSEPSLFDDMGMTNTAEGTDNGMYSAQTQINLTNSTHPLGAGLSGTQTLFTTPAEIGFGVPNANAVSAATLTANTTKTALFGYEKGVSMFGITAPARRVGLFLRDLGPNQWNSTGAQLFESAITWALTGN
jgi:hypothetical protein